MPIRAPRLELRLHMSSEIRLGEHQSALVVLLAHYALRSIDRWEARGLEDWRELQVGEGDVDVGPGFAGDLEAEVAVPSLQGMGLVMTLAV